MPDTGIQIPIGNDSVPHYQVDKSHFEAMYKDLIEGGFKPSKTPDEYLKDLSSGNYKGLDQEIKKSNFKASHKYLNNENLGLVYQDGQLPGSEKKEDAAPQQESKTPTQGKQYADYIANGMTPQQESKTDTALQLPKDFDFSAKSNNPEAQKMIADKQAIQKQQLQLQQEEQKKMEDSFKLSTGLYQQTKNGVEPIEKDNDKFLKQYDKSADTYFITQHSQGWTEEEKKIMPLVKEYYNATTDEQRADLRTEIKQTVPGWNPLPKEQWNVLDSMKLGVYESSAATQHHVQKEYENNPVSYNLQEINGAIGGESTYNDANSQAISMADTYSRAYYLGENVRDINNWQVFGQNATKALTNPISNWAGKYQTNDEYVSNLQSVYKSYFDQKNDGQPNASKKSEEDTKNFMDAVQNKSINPTVLRNVATSAGGMIGSLPYYIAASSVGNYAANIAGLSKVLINGESVINSMGGEFMKKTLTDAVPMATIDSDKRRGALMGYAFGAAGELANKIGVSIEGTGYNGAMKLLMNNIAKPAVHGATTAATGFAFDAASAMANSEDFEKDLKTKGLDWLSHEGKNTLAQFVIFGIMGRFSGDKQQSADNLIKEIDARKQGTRDKGQREKLDNLKKDVQDMASKEESPFNDKIVQQTATANPAHMAPPVAITHNTPNGKPISTSSHLDFEGKNATIPSASFDNAQSASNFSTKQLKDNGISEISFTDKKQAQEYVHSLPANGYNSYMITTGTPEKPQIHVIAYDKSKAVDAGVLNEYRIKETRGDVLSLNDVANIAGLRGEDPVNALQKIVNESNDNSRGMQAKNAQNLIDRIKTVRDNQALPNQLTDIKNEIQEEQSKKLPTQESVSEKQQDFVKAATQNGWTAEVKSDGSVEAKDDKGQVRVSKDTKPAFSKEGLTNLQEIIDNHAKSEDATQKADFYKKAAEEASKEGMTIGYDHNNRIVARKGSKVVVSAQVGYKSLEDFKKKSPELSQLVDENNIFYRLTNLPSDKKNFSMVVPGMDDTQIKQAVSDIFAGHSNYITEKLLNRLAKYADGSELVQVKTNTGRKMTWMMPEFLQKTEGDLGKPESMFKEQATINFTDDNSPLVEEQNVNEYLKTKGVESVQKERFDALSKDTKNSIDKFIDDAVLGKKAPTDEQKKLASEHADLIEQRIMQKQVEAQSKPYPGIPETPIEPATEETKVGMEEPATVIETAKGQKVIERKKTTRELVAELPAELQKRTVVVPKTAVDVLAGTARMGGFKEYVAKTPEYMKYAGLNVDNATMAMFKDGVISFDDADRISEADSQYNLSQLEQIRKPVSKMKTYAEQNMDEDMPVQAPKTIDRKRVITSASAKSIMENIKKGDGEAIKDWVGRNGKVYDLDADALKHSEVVNIIDALKQNGVINQDQWQEMAKEWKKQQIKQNKVVPVESADIGSMISRLKEQRAKQIRR